ncbi:MAG: hypothetical protein WAJ85_13370, partial [Candidatus Baltobacteraceae bacterium]
MHFISVNHLSIIAKALVVYTDFAISYGECGLFKGKLYMEIKGRNPRISIVFAGCGGQTHTAGRNPHQPSASGSMRTVAAQENLGAASRALERLDAGGPTSGTCRRPPRAALDRHNPDFSQLSFCRITDADIELYVDPRITGRARSELHAAMRGLGLGPMVRGNEFLGAEALLSNNLNDQKTWRDVNRARQADATARAVDRAV